MSDDGSPAPERTGRSRPPRRRLALRLLSALLPEAERDEVVDDLAAEHERRAASGGASADVWLWRQVLVSVPSLLRRGWWRGWSGFEPEANRLRTGGPMFETWIMDARYAVRRLVKRPTYALLAVLTLALGVGGTAAISGIVRELLFSPLPIAAEEDVALWWMGGLAGGNWSAAELVHLRDAGTPGFDAVAAFVQQDVRLASDAGTLVVPAVWTSADLLAVLGTRPALGPGFEPGDDLAGAEVKVILSHGMWRDLGADPGVIGTTVDLNGLPRVVAGVMPAGFWFPNPDTRLWLSHGFSAEAQSGMYTIIGRLAAGQRPGETTNALASIAAGLGERFSYAPEWDNSKDPVLTPVREAILGPIRPTLIATLAAMAVILLIACANVAALMLGQVETRGTELSVRGALGAGRGRLVQQLLAEGLAVGAAAGAAGAVVAAVSFRLLLAALPLGALAERATLDWQVFWFALALALVAALAISFVPVVAMLRAAPGSGLSRGRTGGVVGRGGRLENGLVVAEVALAVVIAAGAAVLIRSVANLRAIDTGMDAANVAVIDIVAPAEAGNAGRAVLMQELIAELGVLPGVEHAAAVQRLPLRGGGDNWGVSVEGRPDLEGTTTAMRVVTHDYFSAIGARLRGGRLFDAGDRAGTERVVVINEAFARRIFPGQDPIGMRIGTFGEQDRIVGIIADIREVGLREEAPPARYFLYDQVPYAPTSNSLVFRVADGMPAMSILPAALESVRRTSPTTGIQQATTLDRVVDRALGPAKQLMALLSLLAGLALLLGGIGVYGVVSHFVNRRRRDWGIRMALGFRPRQVIGHVVGRGTTLVMLGIVLGVAGAFALTRLLGAFVYGIDTADPAALAGAALVLLATGVIGSLIPAHRASRVDPARVLREQ